MMLKPTFRSRPQDAAVVQRLNDAGIHPIIFRVLAGRGVTDPKEVPLSLRDLEHPDRLHDIDKAARLVTRYILEKRQIIIAGDYDSDGCTATALLVDFLTQCGAMVDYLIPNRITEGYGLSPSLVERAAALKADCIITVDNGISALAGYAAGCEVKTSS